MAKAPKGQGNRKARAAPEDRPDVAGQRIAKVIARAGLCSRRDAERWIADGRVHLNGRLLTSPAVTVAPTDTILVDRKPLPETAAPQLWRYHKPRGRVTTHRDPQGRPTVFEALPDFLPRVISVGRLDFNTEGLLLLTTDGALARHLELPATGWLRRYRVRAHGTVDQKALDKLEKGIELDGIRYGPIEARLDRTQGANIWLTIGLREGKNREVRQVLGHLGLEVNRLIRISYGPFQLGDLDTGAIEEVKTRVIAEQIGPKLAHELGLVADRKQKRKAAADKPTSRKPTARKPSPRRQSDKSAPRKKPKK